MNKFGQGLFVGVLITLVLISSVALAVDNPIKLIINGQEIIPDVTPQLINGRVLVPARFVAEALGAKVDWNQENRAVVITAVEKGGDKEVSQGWLTLREVVEIKKWSVYPNGQVYDVGDNYIFNYNDVENKIIDDVIYLPSSIMDEY